MDFTPKNFFSDIILVKKFHIQFQFTKFRQKDKNDGKT